MEENKQLIAPIEEEAFEEKIHDVALNNYQRILQDFSIGILHLRDYSGVSKFKSIRRAIKRGHVSIFGDVYPKRPFKNISTKHRRKGKLVEVKTGTYLKKKAYEQLTNKSKRPI